MCVCVCVCVEEGWHDYYPSAGAPGSGQCE